MTDIKATVIIAAWNAEAELSRSIHSALAQTIPVEVIVADDASTDGTASLVDTMAQADPRIALVRLAVNGGPGAARNAAIEAALGDWIAVLDADDTMRPDRLAKMIAEAETADADAVFDDFQAVDPSGRPIGTSHLGPLSLSAPERWDLARFLAGCQARPGTPSLGYLKPVLRKSFLDRTGLRYDPSLRNGEDFHLIADLLARGGRLRVLPFVGYLYTRRPGSVSARLRPDHARALARADWDFLARHDLTPAERSLMLSRRRNLDDLAAAEMWMAQLRTGRIDRFLLGLGRRPRAVRRFTRQLAEGFGRRLRR